MMRKHILVTGGAGYIGSHIVDFLLKNDFILIVVDISPKEPVPGAIYFHGKFQDKELMKKIREKYPKIDYVIHLAAFIKVEESEKDPGKYFANNVGATSELLKIMHELNIKNLIFSSTAAVYGTPTEIPIKETHPLSPTSNYGLSKVWAEEAITRCAKAYGINYVIFRYFNVAGANPAVSFAKDAPSDLISLVLKAASGRLPSITINGNDYKTVDGTAIRDFIHVFDLCQAHTLALEYLNKNKESLICNLGSGEANTVKEVVDTAKEITGKKFRVEYGPKLPGDVPASAAGIAFAKEKLGWVPTHSTLQRIIHDAWTVELKQVELEKERSAKQQKVSKGYRNNQIFKWVENWEKPLDSAYKFGCSIV